MRKHALSFLLLSPALLLSLPRDPQLIHGTAALEQTGGSLSITASDQAILHWRDFSIEENETARFILPASDSSILNRVIDAYPSRLLGKIEANGRVLLINPNGVLVGANAQIDAGAFIASSLDVLDSAYLEKSELAFSGSSDASIANHGRIVSSAGEVFLLGRHVENHGSLCSKSDAGAIAAARAALRPAAGGWQLVSAEGQKLDSPSIALIAGSVHAAGRHAVVLGDWVELRENAVVDVSSDSGEGSVWIGGTLRGENRDFLHAQRTYVDTLAAVRADALLKGNGGEIIVWADEALSCRGTLSARGGLELGNGGFVEVSSPGFYDFLASVDTRAFNGSSGTLLMDPSTISINAGPNFNVSFGGGCGALTYCSPGANGTIAIGAVGMPGTLLDNLSLGNVTVDSSQGAGGTGNISLSAALGWAVTPVGGSTLTLIASGLIQTIGGGIITNSTPDGNIVMTAAGNINLTRDIFYTHPASTATLTLTSTGGNISTATISHAGLSGDVLITAAGTITNTNDISFINAAAANTLTITGTGAVTIANPVFHAGTGGDLFITSTGSTLTVSDDIDFTNPLATGDILLDGFAGISTTVLGPISTAGAAGNIALTSGAGSISLGSALSFTNPLAAGDLTLSAPAGNITTTVFGDITHAGAAATANTILTAGGPITLNGNITYSNPAALGSISITSGNGLAVNAAITATTTGQILFTDFSAAAMTFSNNAQNAGTGTVRIDRSAAGAGPVAIGPSIINVSVGSSDGLTELDAPNSAVSITGASSTSSQLGFFTAAGATSAGPITVNCDTLSLSTNASPSAAQIGHGQANNVINFSTAATATINVTAASGITLDSSTAMALNSHCTAIIGHGSRTFNTLVAPSPVLAGDITVLCTNGNILLQHSNPTVSNAMAMIGHGVEGYMQGGVNIPTVSGNITVQAPAGGIQLLSNVSSSGNLTMIGHGGSDFGAVSITSDIYVSCLGDLTLDGITPGPMPASQRVSIGAHYVEMTPNITQNIRVTAGGDIFLGAVQRTSIGTLYNNDVGAIAYVGDTQVIAGGDITLRTGVGDVFIGVNIGTSTLPALVDGRVYVAAGGTIFLDGTQSMGPGSATAIIGGGDDVAVAANGDIVCTAGPGCYTAIGTMNRNGGGATSFIYAGGNILATNGPGAGDLAYMGFEFQDTTASPLLPYNIDIRAKGDVQMAADIDGTGVMSAYSTFDGFIFIEADSCFAAGALWGYTGSDITSVCGVPFDAALPIPETNLLPAPANAPSPAINANGRGAFRVLTTPAIATNHLTFETTGTAPGLGNITVHSAPLRIDGTTLQNLSIGGVGNDLAIVTDGGDLDISGTSCRCQDGFNNITANSVAAPFWTTGSIYGRAATHVTVNTLVATGGAAAPITLISDCFNGAGLPAGGDITLNADVATSGGDLSLSAGRLNGTFPCALPNECAGYNGASANIFHNSGTTASCLLDGEIVELATGSITLTDADVATENGSIHMVAGVDINIGSSIQVMNPVVSGGEILLIANNDINLTNAAALIASPNAVTLVADNAFPASPLSGLGGIHTALGSSITGTPLQLFTSQQGYNSLAGTLNGLNFSLGTLFEDTPREQWCTYFGCPFQRAGLGDPYTVFYKNCLQQVVAQAALSVDQFLVSLHPYNEFPGWMAEFYFLYQDISNVETPPADPKDRYLIRRRNLNVINHPKTWTAWLNEARISSDEEEL